MTATQVLCVARAANIAIRVDGDDLILEASAPPPAAVLDLLSRHKLEVVHFLRTSRDGWSKEEWQTLFEEDPVTTSGARNAREPRRGS